MHKRLFRFQCGHTCKPDNAERKRTGTPVCPKCGLRLVAQVHTCDTIGCGTVWESGPKSSNAMFCKKCQQARRSNPDKFRKNKPERISRAEPEKVYTKPEFFVVYSEPPYGGWPEKLDFGYRELKAGIER